MATAVLDLELQQLDAGTATRSGGDDEMFSRILRAGFNIVYEPAALSWHRHRRTWEELRQAVHGYGVGVYALMTHRLLIEGEFSGSGKTASILLPRVHRVASLLKRWLLGTHQSAVSREHLDYYLDEFTSDSTDASHAAVLKLTGSAGRWPGLRCGMKIWFGETAAKPHRLRLPEPDG